MGNNDIVGKAKTVIAFYKDAYCVDKVEIQPVTDAFKIKAIIKCISNDDRGTFYIAHVKPMVDTGCTPKQMVERLQRVITEREEKLDEAYLVLQELYDGGVLLDEHEDKVRKVLGLTPYGEM